MYVIFSGWSLSRETNLAKQVLNYTFECFLFEWLMFLIGGCSVQHCAITPHLWHSATRLTWLEPLVLRSWLPCADPISGPGPKWEKMAEKWILAPQRKRGKMAEKREIGQNWVKSGHFPIIRPFLPLFPEGPKSIFWPFSGRRLEMGSVQGNQDRNSCAKGRRGHILLTNSRLTSQGACHKYAPRKKTGT